MILRFRVFHCFSVISWCQINFTNRKEWMQLILYQSKSLSSRLQITFLKLSNMSKSIWECVRLMKGLTIQEERYAYYSGVGIKRLTTQIFYFVRLIKTYKYIRMFFVLVICIFFQYTLSIGNHKVSRSIWNLFARVSFFF